MAGRQSAGQEAGGSEGGNREEEEVLPVKHDLPSLNNSEIDQHESEGEGDVLVDIESEGGDSESDDEQPNVLDPDDKVDLGPWLDPEVPGPFLGPLQDDGDGWNRIDRLGVWECGLSSFRSLEEVPTRFREKWAKVMSTIFRRLQKATMVEEGIRALKWFLIAPQAFLREPKRGGKKGQIFSALNARFDCVVREDFGTILALLESDKMTARQRRGRARREPDDDLTANSKLRKTVLSLLKRGQVSRAVRRICSHGIASMDDPQVHAALQAKYPRRGRDLPAAVTRTQCMESLDMKDSLLKLDPGVSPGFGGLRNEHLRCLAETWEQQDMALLDSFGLRYVNGDLPPFIYKVWGSGHHCSVQKWRQRHHQASWCQIFIVTRSPQGGGWQEQGPPE